MKIGYHDGVALENNASTFLKKHAEENPKQVCLYWAPSEKVAAWYQSPTETIEHQSISNAALYQLVQRTAQGFKDLGIESGDRVIIFIPMSLPMYTAMFACQYLGAIPVFLDSWARKEQMGASVTVSSPKAIVSVDQAYQYFEGVQEIDEVPIKVCFGPGSEKYTSSLEALFQVEPLSERQPVEKEHTALITFTTGSSGVPKGANRTHRFLAAQHYAINRHLPYGEKDIDMPTFPIFSLNNIAAGVPTVIPAIDLARPRETDSALMITQYRSLPITTSTMSPSLMNGLSQYGQKTNQSLKQIRRMVTGGAPVSKDDCVNIKKVCTEADVLVLYGSTEVEPMAHIEARTMIAQKTSEDPELVDNGVNVGQMDEGLETKFLKIIHGPVQILTDSDWESVEVLSGEVGEIIVSGEHVCREYYNNTEAFAKTKIKDNQERVWHRTGDLGRVDENGDLWIVGRVHNAIKRSEKYYFPVRSEVILKRLDFVERAAYLGIDDDELGQKCVCAFSLKGALSEQNTAQFKSEILRVMAKNDIPVDDVFLCNEIPMDPRHHSKVEYQVLRNQLGTPL